MEQYTFYSHLMQSIAQGLCDRLLEEKVIQQHDARISNANLIDLLDLGGSIACRITIWAFETNAITMHAKRTTRLDLDDPNCFETAIDDIKEALDECEGRTFYQLRNGR